ncbi:MAG: PPC domain-containing protein, partial [Anaerolineales bacterium]
MRPSRLFTSRRLLVLILPVLLGLGAAALLLGVAPARPAQAAAQPAAVLAPAGCDNDAFEPNNFYTQATWIEAPATLYGENTCFNGSPEEEDWYSMTLPAGQRVMIFLHFTHANADLDMYLYHSNFITPVVSSNGVVDNEKIDYMAVSAGTYYLRVLKYVGIYNTYDLSFTGGCFAHAANDFDSVDAQAVRDAIAEAAPGSTVKIGGYCPGTVTEGGGAQTALVTKTLTLAGGYEPGNWNSTTLTNPTVLDAMGGGAVVSSSAALTLTHFTITKGLNESGGGLYSTAETVLDSMIFYGNVATATGGGAYIEAAALITNSGFFNNAALSNAGGGLVALQATVSGSAINGNRAALSGGGLYAPLGFSLSGTSFADNQAASGGAAAGGFFSSVTGGTFASNRALSGEGGALSVDQLELNGTFFTGNTAATYGGAVAAVGDTHLVGARFTQNSAAYGGAVGVQAPATLEGVTLQGNHASVAGGGMLAGDSLVISATQFLNNEANVHGGGLAQSYELPLTRQPALSFGDPGRLVNVVFAYNFAASGRDLSLAAPLTNTLLHNTFIANQAPVTASIQISAGSLLLRNSLFTGAPAALKQIGGSLDEDYDLFFGGGGTVAGYLNGAIASGGHSFVADPLTTGIYAQLTLLSPARDAGQPLGVTTDFDGDPRPI